MRGLGFIGFRGLGVWGLESQIPKYPTPQTNGAADKNCNAGAEPKCQSLNPGLGSFRTCCRGIGFREGLGLGFRGPCCDFKGSGFWGLIPGVT